MKHAVWILLAVPLFAGCGGDAPEPDPEPRPQPKADATTEIVDIKVTGLK